MSLSQLALPPELWDAILDHLHHDRATLRAAALVCRTWVPTSRFYLFEDISLSPKYPARAAYLNALLMSPHSTIAPAVRKLALPGALTPIQVCTPSGVRQFTSLIGLVPSLAYLPRLVELEVSDLALAGAWKTVERLTLTGVCAGPGLLRVVQALPRLTQLTLECVTAIVYHGGGRAVESGPRTVAICGSSLAFLGWAALAAPHVVTLSVDTLVSAELHFLAEYLCVLGATLQHLDLTFFDLDPLDAFALPTILEPCISLEMLRLHFNSEHDIRRFFAFGCQGPWPPAMRIEIVVDHPTEFEFDSDCENLDELFHDSNIDVCVVHSSA
ncbi:hypothetical protein MSAN_02264200 [Mycena sanguinolenta]|uniref:F-box domain-containing protein n=1 Tax=Mycena sanguinolenta TaxID=230812 RepID=A0A8H6XB90_9AGAR|nr:hypothetical protein MSAN_02264200 [Mycena sanguinolenta]